MSDHPYLPRDLLIQGFVRNDVPAWTILSVLGTSVAGVLFVSWMATSRWMPDVGLMRRLAVCWFAVCAFIHAGIEGWFVVFHREIPGDSSFLSQLWKEYSKGDSRYIIGDTFTVCMEGVTAIFWGPLSAFTAFAFLRGLSSRYVLQLCLSLGQLYGLVLYFITEWLDGFQHTNPGHPLHFWFYFFFMNALWLVVPVALITDAAFELSSAQLSKDARLTQRKKQ
uniref:EBP cholestenol delta-isomerase n=1 Tax=Eptatretus burgeri TaxID=7764 RepID=A0A8C4R0W8_EPTBU